MGTHTNSWRENTGLAIIPLFVAAWQGLSYAVRMIV